MKANLPSSALNFINALTLMTPIKFLFTCILPVLIVILPSCDQKRTIPELSEVEVKDLRERADMNDPRAQYNLAQCYIVGQPSLKANQEESIKLLTRSAIGGFPLAQLQIGDIYAKGTTGVPKDINSAYQWWLLAMAGGIKDAETLVLRAESKMSEKQIATNRKASYMLYVTDVRKDGAIPRHVIHGFFANKGDVRAQSDLADCYLNGEGVAQDHEEAIKWYSVAANEGYGPAEVLMGQIYAEGLGVPKNAAESAKWYTRAAIKGEVTAQSCIALAFAEGNGVPVDAVEAYKWWNLASVSRGEDGDEMARFRRSMANCRDTIAVQMTREQIAEAQRKCRDWKPLE